MPQRLSKLSREMETKIGDVYIRNSDGQIFRVRWFDHKSVVLETEKGDHLRLTSIYGLEKGYRKKESNPN